MVKKATKEQLTVPAHIDYLADLRDFVAKIGKKYHVSDRIIKSFKLAIDEAATNVIHHAYRESSEPGEITIRAIIKKAAVTFCIIDQGKYFDPQRIKDPDLNRYVEIGKRGGLGIFIMRRLMDDVEYLKTEEGNVLRLTKRRAEERKRRFFTILPRRLTSIPLGLKMKFWAMTSAIVILLVGLVYGFYFFTIPINVLQQRLAQWTVISEQIIANLGKQREILDDITGGSQNALLSSYITNRTDEIYQIALVDTTGLIIGHSTLDTTFSKFRLPADARVREVQGGARLFQVALSTVERPFEVYDYATKVILPDERLPLGTLHLRVHKAYVDRISRARRWELGRLALMAIAIGCGGSFLLIYLLLNPLRKLAEWVRTSNHGQLEDEIDIDPSTEVGEIAKAFTEITSKFRESQKNLAEQERLQKEMQVAQEIQQTLLPKKFPDIEGYEIAGHYEAAQLIGGDYYDFVDVDRDTIGIVVADVSGKGVPGSMVMTMIRQALRTEARGVKDAAEVLTRLNDLVIGDMKKGMFVTIFYVIIDSKRRRLNYASAGHNPMILYRASTNKTYYLNPHGFPIGIELPDPNLFRKSIESDTVQLAEDDALLLYTDGITEAMNNDRKIFGEERLLQVLRQNGRLRAKPFVEKLCDALMSFTEGSPQSDDITFVCIREKSSMRKEEFRRAKEAYRMIMAGTSIRHACERAGISTSSYYNKYKTAFENQEPEEIEIDEATSVENKHIAIEDKAKLFDIIKHHPEYGAKRISEELNTEKYFYTKINEKTIYQELVRMRLNTRQLREAFVTRGGRRQNRPIKPPGTPMLTLDGRVIIDRQFKQTSPSTAAPFKQAPAEIEKEPVEDESTQMPPQPVPETTDADRGGQPDEQREVPYDSGPDHESWRPLAAGMGTNAENDNSAVPGESLGADVRGDAENPLIDEDFTGFLGEQSAILDEEGESEEGTAAAVSPGASQSAGETHDAAEPEPEGKQGAQDDAASAPAETAKDRPEIEEGPSPGTTEQTGMPIAEIGELLKDDEVFISALGEVGHPDAAPPEKDMDSAGESAAPGDEKAEKRSPSGRILGQTTRSMDLQEELLIEGFRLYKNKNFHEAISQFRKIVKLFPEFTEAYRILGNAYFRVGEFDRAAETYLKIKELDPEDTFAFENLGIIYSKQGKYEMAIREWQRLLLIDPERADIRARIEIIAQKLDEPSTF